MCLPRRAGKKPKAVSEGAGPAPGFTGREVRFTLPYPTPLLNKTLRTHWAKLGRMKKRIAFDAKILTQGQRHPTPFARAHVRIERHTSGSPDEDGMIGGFKALIDCLLPPGKPYLSKDKKWVFPHPGGLSIIADDNPAVMRLEAVAVRIKPSEQAITIVIIRELA
jgi:hypothetical protein